MDGAHSTAGHLVGVGRGGDVTWWRVREGRCEDGEEVSVEGLAVLKKSEMHSELRRFGYRKYYKCIHAKNNYSTSTCVHVQCTCMCMYMYIRTLYIIHMFSEQSKPI